MQIHVTLQCRMVCAQTEDMPGFGRALAVQAQIDRLLVLEVLIWQLSWQMLRWQILSWRLVILRSAAVAEWRQVLLLLCCTLQDPLRLPEHYMHKVTASHHASLQILPNSFPDSKMDVTFAALRLIHLWSDYAMLPRYPHGFRVLAIYEAVLVMGFLWSVPRASQLDAQPPQMDCQLAPAWHALWPISRRAPRLNRQPCSAAQTCALLSASQQALLPERLCTAETALPAEHHSKHSGASRYTAPRTRQVDSPLAPEWACFGASHIKRLA